MQSKYISLSFIALVGAVLLILLGYYASMWFVDSQKLDRTYGYDSLNYPLMVNDDTRASLCSGLEFINGGCGL